MTSPAGTEVREDLAAALEQVLASGAVLKMLEEEVLVDTDPEIKARVTAMIERNRQSLLGQAASIPVVEDLHRSLALGYMELKSQWIQRQVRVCYEEMVTGSCDRETALEASAISTLMALIEPLIDGPELQKLQEIFASMTTD